MKKYSSLSQSTIWLGYIYMPEIMSLYTPIYLHLYLSPSIFLSLLPSLCHLSLPLWLWLFLFLRQNWQDPPTTYSWVPLSSHHDTPTPACRLPSCVSICWGCFTSLIDSDMWGSVCTPLSLDIIITDDLRQLKFLNNLLTKGKGMGSSISRFPFTDGGGKKIWCLKLCPIVLPPNVT